MPKPSTLPEWDTTAVNVVVTTSGHKTAGFITDEIPSSKEENYWRNLVYQWIAYLDAGVWDDNLHVTGTLEVDGDAQFNTNINVAGQILSSSSVVEIGQDTNVIGHVQASELLYFAGTEKHGIPLTDGFEAGSVHTIGPEQIILAASTNSIVFPIRLPVGAVITAFQVRMAKNTSSSDEITFDLFRMIDGVPVANGMNAGDASNAPGTITLTSSGGGPETVQALRGYMIRCDPSGSVAPAADRIYAIDVHWNKPAP